MPTALDTPSGISAVRTPPPPRTKAGEERLRRFAPAEYAAMVGAGVLTSGDPVELLEGLIVEKEMRTPAHDAGIDLFRAAFAPFVLPGSLLRSQQAVGFADSTPEPDFSLVRGTPRSFLQRHPTAAETLLVVEIAHSSVVKDRTVMARVYARAAVPVYWIVNLLESQVEVFSHPAPTVDPPAFREQTTYRIGGLVPVFLAGTVVGTIPAADLLP